MLKPSCVDALDAATLGKTEAVQDPGNALVASATLGIRSKSDGDRQSPVGMPSIEVSEGNHGSHATIRYDPDSAVSCQERRGIRGVNFSYASLVDCRAAPVRICTYLKPQIFSDC